VYLWMKHRKNNPPDDYSSDVQPQPYDQSQPTGTPPTIINPAARTVPLQEQYSQHMTSPPNMYAATQPTGQIYVPTQPAQPVHPTQPAPQVQHTNPKPPSTIVVPH